MSGSDDPAAQQQTASIVQAGAGRGFFKLFEYQSVHAVRQRIEGCPMKKMLMLALMVSLPSGVLAHSKIEETTPGDGTTVTDVPAEIGLNFSDDIRLTRVEMVHEEHSAVGLDLGNQTSFDQVFTIPLPSSGSGTYVIEWRGLGEDGHAMQGEFSFTVE